MRDRLNLHRPPRWLLVAGAISLIPVVRMARWVRRGSHVQYADYWSFIDGFFGADGGFAVVELTRFQSQHLVSVPLVTYWVNMRLWGGSNITLGLFVVGSAAATVGVCWSWIADGDRVRGAPRVALAVAIACIAFAPNGWWNFLRAMSGTAWWLANLFVVVAITLAARKRVVPAILVSLLAVATYGTALAVWPALLVVVGLRHRSVRSAVQVAVVGAAATVSYLVLRARTGQSSTATASGAVEILSEAATLVGGLLVDGPGGARLLGAAVLVVLVVAATLAVRVAPEAAAPWAALGVVGAGNAALIAYSRGGDTLSLFGGEAVMLHSRYSSIAALTWIAALGLALVALGPDARGPLRALATAIVVAVALSAALGGADSIGGPAGQDDLGDHLRVGAAAGGPWLVFEPFPELTPLLASIGHHPFDSRYDGGCGLLGTTVDADDTIPTSGEVTSSRPAARVEPRRPSAVLISSSVGRPGWDFECAAVTDGDGAVIGVGRGHDGGQDPDATDIRAVAPTGADRYVLIVRFRQSDQLYALPAVESP